LDEVANDKDHPIVPRTVAGYRTAVATIHQGFEDGTTVSSNKLISDFLKGLFHTKAVPKPLSELWDLPLVLDYLSGRNFEPLGHASFRNVTRKAVFLVTLASGRRVSWVHACHRTSAFTRIEKDGITFLPYLKYDKNQTMNFTPSKVFIPSLKKILLMINFTVQSGL